MLYNYVAHLRLYNVVYNYILIFKKRLYESLLHLEPTMYVVFQIYLLFVDSTDYL